MVFKPFCNFCNTWHDEGKHKKPFAAEGVFNINSLDNLEPDRESDLLKDIEEERDGRYR